MRILNYSLFFFCCSLIFFIGCSQYSEKNEDDFLKNIEIQIKENIYQKNIFSDSLAKVGLTYSRNNGYKKKEGVMANFRGTIAFNKRYTDKAFLDTALVYYTYAHKIFLDLNYKEGLADSFFNIGLIHRNKGKNDIATDYYEKSLYIEKKLNRPKGLLFSLNAFALLYEIKGEYQKALNLLYDEALPILAKYQSDSNYFYNHAVIYSAIGVNYYKLEQDEKAILYFKKSLKFTKKDNNYDSQCYAYEQIGSYYLENLQPDSAKIYFDSLGLINQKLTPPYFTKILLSRYVSCFIQQEQLDSAEFYLSKIFERNNEPNHNFFYLKGQFLQKQKNYLEAIKNFSQALQLSNKTKDVGANKNYISRISQCYASLNNFPKAFEYLQQYLELIDSIQYLDLQKLTLNIEDKYQNDLLKKENTIQTQNIRELWFTIIGISIFLLTTIIFLYVLRTQNQTIKKNNKQLKEKNEQITQQQKEIAIKNQNLEISNVTITKQRDEIILQKDYLQTLVNFYNDKKEETITLNKTEYNVNDIVLAGITKIINSKGKKGKGTFVFFKNKSSIYLNYSNMSLNKLLLILLHKAPLDFAPVNQTFIVNLNHVEPQLSSKFVEEGFKEKEIYNVKFPFDIELIHNNVIAFPKNTNKTRTLPSSHKIFKERFIRYKYVNSHKPI